MDRISDDWLTNSATQRVLNCFTRMGHQAYVVGGCVRNALLGLPVADIDVSTSARPKDVVRLAENSGYKVIPTGIDHGTVTVVIDDVPFEVTTFRRDVETDGRRAVVAFSNSVTEDARRRDFTMNALYADSDGLILDPLGGLPDLRRGRVRFIENSEQRIREDYLRSLRYFRFYALYGNHSDGPDPEALSAISRSLDGLRLLARERVGNEILKLLGAPDPAPALAAMASTGVLTRILPGSDPRFVAPLVLLENYAQVPPEAIRRLAALGGEDVEGKLRLSSKQARRLAILNQVDSDVSEISYRHDATVAWDVALLRAATTGNPLPHDTALRIERGATAVFPVSAADLMPEFEGKALGDRLEKLESLWIASGFSLDKEDLLDGVSKKG